MIVWMYECTHYWRNVWMYKCMNVYIIEGMYECVNVYIIEGMYECMNVWMYTLLKECMNVWMYECIHYWRNVWMYTLLKECMNVWMYECMNECMNVWMYECMNECMNVWMYECMNVCMYEWMYECMYECMNVYIIEGMYECMNIQYSFFISADWRSSLVWDVGQELASSIGKKHQRVKVLRGKKMGPPGHSCHAGRLTEDRQWATDLGIVGTECKTMHHLATNVDPWISPIHFPFKIRWGQDRSCGSSHSWSITSLPLSSRCTGTRVWWVLFLFPGAQNSQEIHKKIT